MSSGSQSSLVFLDTNIWLYAFIAGQDTNKSKIARDLIRRSEIIISSQVINEVCVNLIKKAQLDESSIHQIIEAFYSKYRIGVIDRGLLLKASDLRKPGSSLFGTVSLFRAHSPAEPRFCSARI